MPSKSKVIGTGFETKIVKRLINMGFDEKDDDGNPTTRRVPLSGGQWVRDIGTQDVVFLMKQGQYNPDKKYHLQCKKTTATSHLTMKKEWLDALNFEDEFLVFSYNYDRRNYVVCEFDWFIEMLKSDAWWNSE